MSEFNEGMDISNPEFSDLLHPTITSQIMDESQSSLGQSYRQARRLEEERIATEMANVRDNAYVQTLDDVVRAVREEARPEQCGAGVCMDPEPSKPYNVTIESLNYGFHVTVGCQQFAIEDVDKLIGLLKNYLTNPGLTQRQWYAGKLL